MISEKKEKSILLLSFITGLMFAAAEFVFAVYSHSHSVLTDAVYDASELIFIALILFLTPLFHKPVSEKHPYGFFQIESIFLIIKGIMMISVSFSVSVEVIESLVSGGNLIKDREVFLFQIILGLMSAVIYFVMKRMTNAAPSPTVKAELVEWKIDIAYSFGMAVAFLASSFLDRTPLAFVQPYFDQIVAIIVMLMTLPEMIKILGNAIKDVFLFSPDEEIVEKIKKACETAMEENGFKPVFFDITRTGRRLWVSVYFEIEGKSLDVEKLKRVTEITNKAVKKMFENCTCELILSA